MVTKRQTKGEHFEYLWTIKGDICEFNIESSDSSDNYI